MEDIFKVVAASYESNELDAFRQRVFAKKKLICEFADIIPEQYNDLHKEQKSAFVIEGFINKCVIMIKVSFFDVF